MTLRTPSSIDEAAEILHGLAEQSQTVSIRGGETSLELGNVTRPVDAAVSTARLDRVVDYAPADQIVTVEAGITLKALQEQLLPHRQRLVLDPPLPSRATLGGIAATNAYGPRRARYGTIKDLVVGMTVVRPDGTIARGGGKVVKNVAGFDVPKLMIGSLGTLAMIATLTLRVHPAPETERSLRFEGCTPTAMRMLLGEMVTAQLEPALVLAIGESASYALFVRFEGFGVGVDAQIVALRDLGARCGLRAEELGPADWAAVDAAHDGARTSGDLRVKIAAPPARLVDVHDRAVGPLAAALEGARCAAYPSVGVAFVSGRPAGADPVTVLTDARSFVEALGGSLVLTAAPPPIRERIDAWGTPPAAFALMRALKERFDPGRRFNPGRFVGGL